MAAPASARLAVDLGGTTTRAALIAGPTLLERREAPTRAADGPDAVVAGLHQALRPWCERCDEIRVAATGRVKDGRVSAVNAATLPGWSEVPLAERLASALGRPVVVVNDAHAAAWGEFRYGSGQGSDGFAFVTVSTGVGGGVVVGRRPLVGARGLGAHLGFLSSGSGVLEAIASGTAIAARGSDAVGVTLTTRAVFAAAAEGDARAEAVIAEAIEALADALVTLRWLVDPERVAIGGSVGLAPGYLERLSDAMRRRPEGRDLALAPAALGADAGLVGAACWPAEPYP